ncbi:hypothetical protein [Kineococcus sp. SYSU DK004]|uniref:hypothetical protein n=1 Tax=Kineococcus sp. SYSU DK004 TaxID=3383125 RepID=UPI003D7DA5BE
MSSETPDVDPRDNAEVRAQQESGSREVSRASDGGAVPSPARPADAVPGVPDESDEPGGTASGDVLEGVLADPEDTADAVVPDEGPERPGGR